ncbi:hypothetical protein B296_00055556 [Ensete ventricosum]|uniref:Uncharacterized protein n=1 Tax=Ensete ventricosum TaxID=4639 RepID=A0A426X3E3_ENSVE|nr:hypothetical protein B296_00055556 [Ensete ventricosum]
MKNLWNDMISLLPLQEFMPLTSVQGKLRYMDSLHTAWILHQVPPKLLRSSIYIELIVALVSTISRVSLPLSSIFASTLISETIIPFGILRLAEQLVSCSAPINALARLRFFANTVPTEPFKSVTGDTDRDHLLLGGVSLIAVREEEDKKRQEGRRKRRCSKKRENRENLHASQSDVALPR